MRLIRLGGRALRLAGLAAAQWLCPRLHSGVRLPVPILAAALVLLAWALSAAAWPGPVAPPASAARIEDRLAVIGVELLLPHLARGEPFARPYAVAIVLAAEDPQLAASLRPIAPGAALGAPTARALAEGFGPVAEAAVRVEAGLAVDGAYAALMLRALRWGAALGAGSPPALAAVQRAEAALARGDLAGAMATLEPLDGAAAAVLAPWRAGLARRLAADAAAERLALLVARRGGAP